MEKPEWYTAFLSVFLSPLCLILYLCRELLTSSASTVYLLTYKYVCTSCVAHLFFWLLPRNFSWTNHDIVNFCMFRRWDWIHSSSHPCLTLSSLSSFYQQQSLSKSFEPGVLSLVTFSQSCFSLHPSLHDHCVAQPSSFLLCYSCDFWQQVSSSCFSPLVFLLCCFRRVF